MANLFSPLIAACAQEEMISPPRDKDVVSSLRLAIATAVGNERYELWFGRCALSIEADLLLVKTPCEFTAQWLRNNFRSEIVSATKLVFGRPLDVRFQVSDEPAQPVEAPAEPEAESESSEEPPTRLSGGVAPKRKFATLETFVAGKSNDVALTSAKMIVERPGAISPLLIWGPPGNGKTHLLEGIWSAVRKQRGRRCVYLTAEQFTTFFVQALHGRGLPSFRRRYREVDLLIIEDVQFFEGKRATINELLYTIDTLLREGRQLVFSANRSLADLQVVGSDLVNRLGGGLVAAVQAPDTKARAEIVRQTAAARGFAIPKNVIEMIANRIQHDARRLIGAVNRLELYHKAKQGEIDCSMAHMALADFFQFDSPSVHLKDIERAVCDQFDVKPQELRSSCRTRSLAQARMLAMWLARRHTKAALSEIGDFFGRSHSTVVSAEKRVNQWVSNDSTVRISQNDYQVKATIRKLEGRLRAS